MIRQNIVIGGFPYIVDLFKGGTNDIAEYHTSKFVLLRKYSLNGIVLNDTDLYVVDKDILNSYINKDNELLFPVTNKNFISFSKDFKLYNEHFSDMTFKVKKSDIYDLYTIEDDNFIEADILCDKVRIYHPNNHVDENSIIHIDCYVNEIHLHLLTKTFKSMMEQGTHASESFSINNFTYSEYVECWVPSPEKLIHRNIFYKENLNLTDIKDNDVYWVGDELITTSFNNKIKAEEKYLNTERSNTMYTEWDLDFLGLIYSPSKPTYSSSTYVSTFCFNFPYTIETTKDGNQCKTYLPKLTRSIINNYTTYPIKITIWPFDEYSNDISCYIPSSTYASNSDIFFSEVSFSISSVIGFDDSDVISICNTFNFPNKEQFKSFRDAYSYYFNVDLLDYEGIIDDESEEPELEQKQCGFELKIWTDYNKRNCVYTAYFEIDHPDVELDDFSFQLTNIFEHWDQYPECLIAQCSFKDKYLGHIIRGNVFTINKDKFKYMLPKQNNRMILSGKQDISIYNKSDMDLSKINFINNITCVIKDDTKTLDNNVQVYSKNEPRVIWKPVFFKVQDLQSIKLHDGLKQNIGINLSSYMSKVDTFKLSIDGKEIVESSRNDIYVIFSINSALLNKTSGTYHILNQDDEYISSGHWDII